MMTSDTALQIVSHELKVAKQSGREVLHITFMGGEPFLNFNVIQCVVKWIRNQNTNVRIEAYTTTNGTVLTEEMKDWLIAHKDILKVQLSYDGTETQQRVNRTSKVIDVGFFF